MPTRLTTSLTVHSLAQSSSSAPSANQSTRGPGQISTTSGRGRRGAGSAVSSPPGSGPMASSSPSAERRRPEPGERVVAARTQDRGHVDAAAHGEVAEQVARRRLDHHELAVADRACDPLDRRGDDRRAVGPHDEPADGLQPGGIGSVADQSVERGQLVRVDGATARHAEVGQPGSTEVLHRRGQPGPHDCEASSPPGRHEANERAGGDQRRRVPIGAPELDVGAAEEVPAAGRGRRVHGAVAGCDRHRAGRDPRPRRRLGGAGAATGPGRSGSRTRARSRRTRTDTWRRCGGRRPRRRRDRWPRRPRPGPRRRR